MLAALRDRPGLVLLLCGVLVVLPGLLMGLHADDWFHIRPRKVTTVLATFAGDWNEGLRGEGGFYRPIVRLSFHVDQSIFGLHAWGYHLTNGVLFLALLGAVYTASAILAGGAHWGVAATVFLLFALNPLKNEALFWVSGRTDLLAAVPLLWAFVLALLAMRTGRTGWAAGAVALLFLAMLAKEVALAGALILPAACLLLASHNLPRRTRLVLLWGPIAAGCVYLAVRWAALGGLGGYAADGPPRPLSHFGENGLRMLSALTWPWQADAREPFRPLLLLPGAAAIAALTLFAGKGRRVLLACLAAVFLSIVPMLPIDIQPDDGARVLLVPLSFATVGVTAALWRRDRQRWMDKTRMGLLVILALTFQPANAAITWDFLTAAKPNRQALAQARQWVKDAPPAVPVVLKESPLDRHRRILHPGASLLMATQTWWHHRPGAETLSTSDYETPQLSLRLITPQEERIAAHALQSWMKKAIVIQPTHAGTIKHLHLVRQTEQDRRHRYSGDSPPLPHQLREEHVTAWELTGEGWDGGPMILEAGLEPQDVHRESAALFRRGDRVAGWLDDAAVPRQATDSARLHLPWLRTGTLDRMTWRIAASETFEGE